FVKNCQIRRYEREFDGFTARRAVFSEIDVRGSAKETCIVVKRSKSIAGSERFVIAPNPARKSQLDKEAHGDIPDYSECGRYSNSPDSEQYFEYQPVNAMTRFMFVAVGQD